MPNLAARVATVDDVHKRNMAAIVEANKLTRQPALYNGETRKYEPFDNQPQNQQPTTRNNVQVKANEQFSRVLDLCREMWDAAATRDRSNMTATGTVSVDGTVLIKDAPVPFLLYLERQILALLELAGHMPIQDPAEIWEHDASLDLWRTEPSTSYRTDLVHKVLTLVQPTEHHPGQAQPYTVQEPIGTYLTTKFTAAWPATVKRTVLERMARLLDAVKVARTEANRHDAVEWNPALAITQYLWPAEVSHQV